MVNKIIGIYKITSPSNRIYIGKSINIKTRFASYKYYDREYNSYNNKNKKSLILLSLKKYGISQHKFEILDECAESELNEREIFYIEKYKSNYCKYPEYKGLNLHEGGRNPPRKYGTMSESIKIKISNKIKERHSKSNNYNYKHNNKSISKYNIDGNLIITYESLMDLIKHEKISITKFVNLFTEFNRGLLKNGEYFQFDCIDKFKYDYKKRKSQIESYLKNKEGRIQKNKEIKERAETTKNHKKPKEKIPWTKEMRSDFFRKLNSGRKHVNRKKPSDKTNIIEHLKKVHKSMEKPVLQYSKDDILLREFGSLKDAAEYCGGKYQGIYRVCIGKRPSAYGYVWKYKESNQDN